MEPSQEIGDLSLGEYLEKMVDKRNLLRNKRNLLLGLGVKVDSFSLLEILSLTNIIRRIETYEERRKNHV